MMMSMFRGALPDRDHSHWLGERFCEGCQQNFPTCNPGDHLCSACRFELYEMVAHRIDASYDPALPQTWDDCARIIGRLYGSRWHETSYQQDFVFWVEYNADPAHAAPPQKVSQPKKLRHRRR